MKKRFTEAQIIEFLRETDAGLTLAVPTAIPFSAALDASLTHREWIATT
ncbi:hypothetical protein [Comamonas testosteroni]|nr:hypothetical protein [Comamonas testosteroni]